MTRARHVVLPLAASAWFVSRLAAQSGASWGCLKLQDQVHPTGAARPAAVQLTMPDTGRASYAVDAALQCVLSGPSNSLRAFALAPGIEWHRNTALDSPQDVLSAGLTGTWFVRPHPPQRFRPEVSISADYKRDGIKDRNALALAVEATVRWLAPMRGRREVGCHVSEWSDAFRPGEYWCVGRSLFRYAPKVGAEFESSADTLRRSSTRLLLGLQTELFPAAEVLKSRLQIVVDGAYRRSTILEGGRRDHWLLSASANVVLLGDLQAGSGLALGVDYVSGADPSKGFARQRYARLALKAQL